MNTKVSGISMILTLILGVLGWLAPAHAANPCCQITAVNAQTGVVTARDSATGRTFEFKVGDRALLRSLRQGQGVYADFKTGRTSFDGRTSSGSIVSPMPGPARLAVDLRQYKLPIVIPYGTVSTVDRTSAVATYVPQHVSFPTGKVLPNVRTVAKRATTQVDLPKAIEFASSQSLPGNVSFPHFCDVFLPIHPQPLSTGQSVWVAPTDATTGTAYRVVFPNVAYQSDDVDVGHMETCIKISSNGRIDGKTRVWTNNWLSGFEGGVIVFLSDLDGNVLWSSPERHWGVNGESLSWAATNDRTEDWHDLIPAEIIGKVAVVGISQLNSPTSHWEDFWSRANEVVKFLQEAGKAYQAFKGGSPTGGTGTDTGGQPARPAVKAR